MHRIDNASANAVKPVRGAAGPKPDAYFDDATRTIVPADFLNAVQDELAEVVEAAGLTLDKADDTQLLQALVLLFSARGAEFNDSRNIVLLSPLTIATVDIAHGLGTDDLLLHLQAKPLDAGANSSKYKGHIANANGDAISVGELTGYPFDPAAMTPAAGNYRLSFKFDYIDDDFTVHVRSKVSIPGG